MPDSQKKIAVLIGGRSVEHDVSVLTGLQFIEALDPDLYTGFPVYVAPDGRWFVGDALRKRSFYPVTAEKEKQLAPASLAIGAGGGGHLKTGKGGLFKGQETEAFDLVVPALHGTYGEDGSLQGLLEFEGIPYAGAGILGSAAAMNKGFSKSVFSALGIAALPFLEVAAPPEGAHLHADRIVADLREKVGDDCFPVCVKPRNLGSSIGVARAGDADALLAALLNVFRLDSAAIVEPFVDNLVEYNVAARRDLDGRVRLSAIERPVKESELLDFAGKYLAGGSGGPKLDEAPSEGMASLNRVLDPEELTGEQETFIRTAAAAVFAALELGGSVRIDFLGDEATGELWINEINTIPGSFAFFLWEAADPPLSFTELTDAMIREGLARAERARRETAAASGGGTIFSQS